MSTRLVRDWIEAGESSWLPMRGHSMAPFLRSGSTVLVCRAAACRIGWGDLAVYERHGRLICHRVLGRYRRASGDLLLMKGDGRRTTDPWVSPDQLVGKVIAVSRQGRVVRLDAPMRRLQAAAAAALSFVTAGIWLVRRRGNRLLCAGAGAADRFASRRPARR